MKKSIILLITLIIFFFPSNGQTATESAKQERPKHDHHNSYGKLGNSCKDARLFHRHSHDRKRGYSKAEGRAHSQHSGNHHGEKGRGDNK